MNDITKLLQEQKGQESSLAPYTMHLLLTIDEKCNIVKTELGMWIPTQANSSTGTENYQHER